MEEGGCRRQKKVSLYSGSGWIGRFGFSNGRTEKKTRCTWAIDFKSNDFDAMQGENRKNQAPERRALWLVPSARPKSVPSLPVPFLTPNPAAPGRIHVAVNLCRQQHFVSCCLVVTGDSVVGHGVTNWLDVGSMSSMSRVTWNTTSVYKRSSQPRPRREAANFVCFYFMFVVAFYVLCENDPRPHQVGPRDCCG